MFRLFSFFTLIVLLAAPFTQARADVFVYSNEDHGVSASFPDHWKIVNNQKPDDILTVSTTGAEDFGLCRIRVREDRRFAIYPLRFSDEVRNVYFDEKFWKEYLREYNDVLMIGFKPETGLGRGQASLAEARFNLPNAEGLRLGMFTASLYNNKLYIAECSSNDPAYGARRPEFLSFIKSIDFQKIPHELTGGHYEDFSKSGSTRVLGPKGHGFVTY